MCAAGLQRASTLEQQQEEEEAIKQFIQTYIQSNPDITHVTKWTTDREVKLHSAAENNTPPIMLQTRDLIKRIKHTLMDAYAERLSYLKTHTPDATD
jgi:hypothetical protein